METKDKKYTLIEKESKAPEYEYKEEFDTLSEAQDKMDELYMAIVINNRDAIDNSSRFDRYAFIETNDGNEITWEIQ